MIRVGVLGAQGKMGAQVVRLLDQEFFTQARLAARVDRGDSLAPLLDVDVVIDFSSPAAMAALAREALSKDALAASRSPLPAFVSGTTGWKPEERQEIDRLAERAPVLLASNFSTGVLILQELLRIASPLLKSLGYTPVIIEKHHRHKKDAPSGTALSLQKAVSPAAPGEIQTHAIRAGEVIGDHEVAFYGQADVISLAHHAQDRSIFARGAIHAALWLAAARNRQAFGGKVIGLDAYFEDLRRAASS